MKFSPLVTASAGAGFLTLSPATSWARMQTVIVVPGIPSGWVASAGTARFDATAAPLGAGALVLSLTETQQPTAFSTATCAGVWLRDLYALQYTVQRIAPAAGTASPVIELDVDFDLRDRSTAPQGKLVYNPAQNGTVTTGTWQTWNASAGKWYFTGGTAMAANASAGQPFPQSTPATLREILTRFPSAGIRAAGGTLSLKAGAEAGPFTAAVDSLTITMKGGGITWNFEPDSDGDRVPDFIDRVPLSDLRTKVEMGFGPTTVNNTVDKSGMSIQDKVLSALLGSAAPAKYITSIAVLATDLQRAGTITPRQKDELKSAAGSFVSRVTTGTPGGGTVAGGTLSLTGGGVTFVNVNTVGGTLTLGGGLVKSGTGTVTVTDVGIPYSGTVTVGSLVIGFSSNVIRNNSPVVLSSGGSTAAGTLSLGGWLASKGTATAVNPGTGSGSIVYGDETQTGVNLGTLVINRSVLNPGNVNVNTGGTNTISLPNSGQAGVNLGTAVFNTSVMNTGNVNVNAGGSITLVRPNNGQAVANTGTAVINSSTLNGGNQILVASGQTLTGSGTIVNTAGLVKSGSGVLTLSSATTYTGTTTINGGILSVSAGGSIGGAVAVNNGGTLLLDTTSAGVPLTIPNDLNIVAGGSVIIRGSFPVKFTGTITNNGTIRTERGATLDASAATGFVNNGTIDRISGTMLLPATLTHGPAARLLDAAAVQVRTAVREGNSFTLTIDGHAGHTFQLQRTNSLDQPFTNTGTPKTGAGAMLTFASDEASAPRGFYRVAVDP